MIKLNKNMMKLRCKNKHNQYYTQKELAKILNITQTQISRIENGRTPKLTDVISYSIFFEVTTDNLIFKEYNIESVKFE